MDVSDRALGHLVLTATLFASFLIFLWINSYPFVDKDNQIFQYIPDPKYFLLFCSVSGALFLLSLAAFTLYHLYPYLSSNTQQSNIDNIL